MPHDLVTANKGFSLLRGLAFTSMDLVLNVVAFASFAVLLAAWATVPHTGRTVLTK